MPKTTPLLKIEIMEKKQTAVEWLVEQLSIEHRVTLIEKAKEMERQQREDDLRDFLSGKSENETFGK